MSFFTTDFPSLVDAYVLSRLQSLGYRRVFEEKGESFDNAMVVVESPRLRVRLVRERGQLFVDFGSAAEPAVWFDSSVVMDALALRGGDGWHSTEAKATLADVAGFIATHEARLAEMFGPATFKESKQRLLAVRERQSVERWGS